MRFITIALAVSFLASAAQAETPSPDRLLDLRQPDVVVAALREAGYRAELKTNAKGEPYVLSGANGSDFTVEFYGCTGVQDCGSYQFSSWYKPEPFFTAALANEWNLKKRFLKVALDTNGSLNEYMDFTATGKTTYANFADIVDWYQTMDSALAKFVSEKRAAAQPAK